MLELPEQLKIEENFSFVFLEALDHGIFIFDTKGKIVFHNSRAAEVLGLSEAQLSGHEPPPQGWKLVYDDNNIFSWEDEPWKLIFTGPNEVQHMTIKLIAEGKDDRYIETVTRRLVTKSGAPRYAIGTINDITDQVRTVEQLTRQHHFRATLNRMVEDSLQEDLGDEFYQHLMENAVAAIPGAQAGSLINRGNDGLYYFVAAVNFDKEILSHTFLSQEDLQLSPGESGPQFIYGFDNSHMKNTEQYDPLYTAGPTDDIKVSLSIPIEVGDQVVAYFNLDNFEDKDAFAPDTIEMAQLFAAQVSILWQRFRLERDLKREQRSLERMAFYDTLTGLPNRSLLNIRIAHAMAQSDTNELPVALIFVDLDNFKQINDSLGHDVGDFLLCEVAQRLRNCVRLSDTVVRWGGDEFVVLLPHIRDQQDAANTAKKILAALNEPFHHEAHELYSGGSIGISLYPNPSQNSEDLIKHADTALYRVKEEGKRNFLFYEPYMDETLMARLHIEKSIKTTLRDNTIEAKFEPRISLDTGEIESLNLQLYFTSDSERFLPRKLYGVLNNKSPLSLALGAQAVRMTFRHLLAWRQLGIKARLAMAAPYRIVGEQTVDVLERAIKRFAIDPTTFELSLFGDDPLVPENIEGLKRIAKLGFFISLQDFGEQYTSFHILRELPAQGFQVNLAPPESNADYRETLRRTLIESGSMFAKSINATLVAKDVTTQAHIAWLRELGCNVAQGPLFGPPLSAEEATQALLERRTFL